MIKLTNLRTRGNERPFDPMVQTRTQDDALNSLLEFELGYGGYVSELTPTKVVSITNVMGCVDTTIFEGTVAEMELLVEAAAAHCLFVANTPERFSKVVNDLAFKVTGGNPLMVKLGYGVLTGEPVAKVVAASLLQDKAAPGQAKVLMGLKLKDLCAVISLVRTDGVPLTEALSLAVATPVFDAAGKIKCLTTA